MRAYGKKYVCTGGYYDSETGETGFEQCLGVFDNCREAIGECVLYLTDLMDSKRDDQYISKIFPLEGDTGFGFELVSSPDENNSGSIDFAHIFIDEGGKSEGAYKYEF